MLSARHVRRYDDNITTSVDHRCRRFNRKAFLLAATPQPSVDQASPSLLLRLRRTAALAKAIFL
jgi:hypothetical protein